MAHIEFVALFLALLWLMWMVWVYRITDISDVNARLDKIEEHLKEIKAAREIPTNPLAYGWYDDGWPLAESDEEKRAPLDNSPYQHDADDYLTATYVSEYRALPSPRERREFLRGLRRERVCMRPGLLDVVYADESPYVRAWAAGHLDTDYFD